MASEEASREADLPFTEEARRETVRLLREVAGELERRGQPAAAEALRAAAAGLERAAGADVTEGAS